MVENKYTIIAIRRETDGNSLRKDTNFAPSNCNNSLHSPAYAAANHSLRTKHVCHAPRKEQKHDKESDVVAPVFGVHVQRVVLVRREEYFP